MNITKHKQWSDAAELGLAKTLRGDIALLQQQVNAGVAELWELGNGSWMITRIEQLPERAPELVVCCYQGQDLKTVGKMIIDSAAQQGLGSIRYHTQRDGLNRLLSEFGFFEYETIYLKVL